jgi:cell division protein YceG involved in septum cleavage
MDPAHTDYLYFVSNNHGHHRFARTGKEHAVNVAAYRRAVAGHP